MARSVTVLLSAYNGEKYIAAQLDSILSQELAPQRILVRDDGSTDHTPDILSAYEKQGAIEVIAGKNVGFKESFRLLLCACPEEDYFAFSDQDDIWLPEKLRLAVDALEKEDNTKPVLYHSAYRMTDERLIPVRDVLPPEKTFDFRRSLTENILSGFAMVGNPSLRREMLAFDWAKLDFHDWLAGAVSLGMGTLLMDDRVTSLHRRLDKSVTADSTAKSFRWAFRSFSHDTNMKIRNAAFYQTYGSSLSEKNRDLSLLFSSFTFPDRLKKAFYPARWRYKLPDEAAVRISMLCGTL